MDVTSGLVGCMPITSRECVYVCVKVITVKLCIWD